MRDDLPWLGQHVGYVRVSSAGQNDARQLDGLPLSRVFRDVAGGDSAKRPALAECLAYVRGGDVLHVHSLDRLARSLRDLLTIVDGLVKKGVEVRFEREQLVFSGEQNPFASLSLALLGAFAEFERSIIRERQKEGIKKAKERGVYSGRKPSLNAEQAAKLRQRAGAGESKSALARDFAISRASVYEYLKG